MQSVLLTIALVAAIGLVGATILVLASRALAVENDQRLSYVRSLLPGLNCGACGHPGCEAYAKAVLAGAPCNRCNPGGARVATELGSYLGADVQAPSVHKAVVACHGACDRLDATRTYQGARSCRVFSTMTHSSKACTFGCLGLGDCVAACPFGALSVNESHVAVVDPARCTGCGLCTTICPRGLISLQERALADDPAFVLCRSTMRGRQAKEVCSHACIGCGKCAKACPAGCITVEHNLATIDVSRCTGCHACMEVCPADVIHALSLEPVNVVNVG